VRTGGRPRARYHAPVPRVGGHRNPAATKNAIIAIGHTVIVIIWNALASDCPYTDLGADFYDRLGDPPRETPRLIATLEALNHTVTIEPPPPDHGTTTRPDQCCAGYFAHLPGLTLTLDASTTSAWSFKAPGLPVRGESPLNDLVALFGPYDRRHGERGRSR
jgi:hypothetical protein